nr:uracil-DNA glycosylase [Paenibacillus sp. YYML68]
MLEPTLDWARLLETELQQPYYEELQLRLAQEYDRHAVYPRQEHIYAALHLTPYSRVKAVILGQDPYHGPGQAHGLSFSVMPGVVLPPSLRNMFKELGSDLGLPMPEHGCLVHWASEGVLLLNTVLTVRDGEPGSHQRLGWETFTDRIITLLNEREQPVVFVLWGAHAQKKLPLIDRSRHHVLCSAHPSPLSARRGFFGSKPYSRTNEYLLRQGLAPINWQLPADVTI